MIVALFIAMTASAQTGSTKKGRSKITSKTMTRVQRDVNRLEAILISLNRSTQFSAETWRQSSNEALMLANRIHANSRVVRKTNADVIGFADDLRMHVREMRSAALKGNTTEARRHINEALPFAYRLDDWATP